MTYLELKEMHTKSCDNVMMTIFGICIFYASVIGVVLLGVAFSNPFLAAELAEVMFIVLVTTITLVILCGIRISLYLTDEMKKLKMK